MEAIHGIIGYHLPGQSAQHYADQALRILLDIEKKAPIALPTFLAANSVLTLSGVRAFDAYHEFYDYVDESQAAVVTDVLMAHGLHLEYGNRLFNMDHSSSSRVFELLNEAAFREFWDVYDFPEAVGNTSISLEFPYDTVHTAAWVETIDGSLANAMSNETLPKAWLNDWYSPLNIRFGMMLGYPAKAIESILWEAIGLQHEESVNAAIEHHDEYFAAWPVYSFAKSLEKDPEILAHEKLWSEILANVYGSDWHLQLKKSASFKQTLTELKRYEAQ